MQEDEGVTLEALTRLCMLQWELPEEADNRPIEQAQEGEGTEQEAQADNTRESSPKATAWYDQDIATLVAQAAREGQEGCGHEGYGHEGYGASGEAELRAFNDGEKVSRQHHHTSTAQHIAQHTACRTAQLLEFPDP